MLTAPLLRLNGLAPYYTMFPLSFPFDALEKSKQGEWVLDPFCGRGTTNLAARLRGLPYCGCGQ
jgi:DNA modification methylase